MKNPTGNKLEKLVFRIFDQMVEGADKYVTKQGSTWLIFTESKKILPMQHFETNSVNTFL